MSRFMEHRNIPSGSNRFDISDTGVIRLTKEDTFRAPLFINQGDELYPMRYYLNEFDTVYFGVLEPGESFDNAIIRKKYTYLDEHNDEGDLIISLDDEDTRFLSPGTYYYAVKLEQLQETGRPRITTIIPNTKFFLME